MNFNQLAKFLLRLAALIMALAASALAQCAMCKTTVANAENAAEVSGRMNSAVLILLFPTLLVIGGLVRLIFKYRHLTTESSSSADNPYGNFRPSDSQRDSQ